MAEIITAKTGPIVALYQARIFDVAYKFHTFAHLQTLKDLAHYKLKNQTQLRL